MSFGNRPNDKALLKDVNKRLSRTGTQTKVTAAVSGGTITLSGALQYEHQRGAIIRAANQASGVRNVVDQMTLQPKKRVDADSRPGGGRG